MRFAAPACQPSAAMVIDVNGEETPAIQTKNASTIAVIPRNQFIEVSL